MDPDLKFETVDLLDDISERLAGTGPEQLLRILVSDRYPSVARHQMLYGITLDLKSGWAALNEPPDDERREGYERALWLRKLIEHLATLVCFADHDDIRDYWLWIALHEYCDVRRLIASLDGELSPTPTPEQLYRVLGMTHVPNSDVAHHVGDLYKTTDTATRPWFIKEVKWQQLVMGDADVVTRWRPPDMRQVMRLARPLAHPVEVSIMGHYQLAYGRYSSQIHARASGDPAHWINLEDDVLLVSIAAILHRLAELTKHRHTEAQLLTARIVASLAQDLRLDGPPEAGEVVELLHGETGRVVDVAREATVAMFCRDSDGTVEIRRSVELLRVR